MTVGSPHGIDPQKEARAKELDNNIRITMDSSAALNAKRDQLTAFIKDKNEKIRILKDVRSRISLKISPQ